MKIIWKTPAEAHIKGTYHRWLVASWYLLVTVTSLVFLFTAWLAVDRILNDKHVQLVYLLLVFILALGTAHFVSWVPPKLYVKYKAKRLTRYLSELNDLLKVNVTELKPLTKQSMFKLFTTGKITSGNWIITVANSKAGEIELLLALRVEEPMNEVTI